MGQLDRQHRQGRPPPGVDATPSPCPRTVCVSVLMPPLIRTPVLGDWDPPGTSSYLEHLFKDPLSKHSPIRGAGASPFESGDTVLP